MTNEDKIDLAFDIFDDVDTDPARFALVGGAPRDIILRKEIRDLDFVVNVSSMRGDKDFHNKIRSFIRKYKLTNMTDGYIESEFIVRSSPDKMINLIQYENSPREFVDNHFDFGICCSLMTGEGQLFVTNWFEQDSEYKHLNLRVRESLSEYSIGKAIKCHAPKIQQKYSDHTLIVTESSSKPTWSKL